MTQNCVSIRVMRMKKEISYIRRGESMTEEELFAKLKKSREERNFRDADDVTMRYE